MKETKYRVKIGRKTLLLTIHESDSSYLLYVGGHELFCIQVQLFKENSVYARFQDVSIGHLPHLYYNVECSLEHDFQRGIDTNTIVRFIQTYIAKEYPYITQLSFTDASYRTCDNGGVTPLPELSYLTTGKTWYQKNFDAVLDPARLAEFEAVDKRFQALKPLIPWNTLNTDYFGTLDSYAEELFNRSETWQDFFRDLRDRMGAAEFCEFCSSWIHRFMLQFMRFPFSRVTYYMPVRRDIISYELQKYSSGGARRSFTRKRRAQQPRDER
jgi:hypothetical protein